MDLNRPAVDFRAVQASTYSTPPALEDIFDVENFLEYRMHTQRTSLLMAEEPISLAEKYCLCRNMDICRCGENDGAKEWFFDEDSKTLDCQVTKEGTEVEFHPRFSVGTACVRGNRPLRHCYQHYFEVKVLTPCFGTDIMVGIGTEKADMKKYRRIFTSLLGSCNETWGFSYKGRIHHNDQWSAYHTGFGQGTLIGVHVDLWRGRILYHINRKLIGVAFANLRDPTAVYYPMICSTAVKSRFRLISAYSSWTNLQYFCCNAVRDSVAYGDRFLPALTLPPAVKLYLENNMGWLLIGSKKWTMDEKLDNDDSDSKHGESSSGVASGSTSSSQRLANTHRLALIPIDHTADIEENTDDQSGPSSPEPVEEWVDEFEFDFLGLGPTPSKHPRRE